MKVIPKRSDKEMKKSVKTSEQEIQERVAGKAYKLFERRGGLHGHDVQDWQEAERLVRIELMWRNS